MKGSWMAVVVVAVAALVACNKDTVEKKFKQLTGGKSQIGGKDLLGGSVYATEWQTLNHWNRVDRGFHAQSPLPLKAEGSKVLLFARNVWTDDAPMEEPMEDIALQLPFNFLPYTDQPGLTESWAYDLQGDQLHINMEVSGSEQAVKPRPVQVRTLYIPDSVWASLLKSGMPEQDLAYEDLVQQLGIKP